MYRNKIMTVIGFFAWILGIAIPFFMGNGDASFFMAIFGWTIPIAGWLIDYC